MVILPTEIVDHIMGFMLFRPKTHTELRDAVNMWCDPFTRRKAKKIYGKISDWDTTLIEDMGELFWNKTFNDDISEWNVSNVHTFRGMFRGCYIFNRDISKWNVEKGRDFSYMFYQCRRFSKSLNNWKMKNATDLSYMFAYSMFGHILHNWENYVDINIPMKNIYLQAGINHYV